MTASAPPTILVVDDDPDTCRNLADILGDLGYRVDTAPDGPSALEKVRRAPYEIALLDFKMPGMNGLELYREIKRLRPETVAIIVSAYTDPSTRDAAIGAGVWQVMPKPVDFPALLGLVDQAVGQPLVMVVDDDHELCENLWQLLRDRGFRVSLAHDAKAAAERVREHEYKVVLIDMRLPDGDGSEVVREVRHENPQARTVIITGHRVELDERVRQAVQEGADAVCYKPFDVPELLCPLAIMAGKK
jgi:CheY-like chemotaxis protein